MTEDSVTIPFVGSNHGPPVIPPPLAAEGGEERTHQDVNNHSPNRDGTVQAVRDLFTASIPYGIGDVYRRVLYVYWYSQQARLMIGLASASLVPATLILMLAVHRIMNALFATTDASDPKFVHKNFLGILLIIMTRLLLNHGVSVLSDAAICYISADICLGRGVGVSQQRRWVDALRHALWNRSFQLIGSGALCFVAIFIGYCFFFVAGVYVVVTLYLTVPALVLEPDLVWPWDGLLRSFELTYDRPVFFLWCHTILITFQTLVAYIIHSLVNILLQRGSEHGGGIGSMFSVWGTFLGMLPSLLFLPAYSILKTILYIRARVELEALTPDKLAEDMGYGRHLLSNTSRNQEGYQQLALQDEDEGIGSLTVQPHFTSSMVMGSMATGYSRESMQQNPGQSSLPEENYSPGTNSFHGHEMDPSAAGENLGEDGLALMEPNHSESAS